MNLQEAIKVRHTVRTYSGKPIEGDNLITLQEMIADVNKEGKLRIQLVNGVEGAFSKFIIHYGKWDNVTNYIALIGKDTPDLDQKCGYYGEKLALWALTAGLKSGWLDTQNGHEVPEIEIADGERLVCCIAIGESEQNGTGPKLKPIEERCEVDGEAPDWFWSGMEYARLAPTAGNQQLWKIVWDGANVSVKSEPGFLEKVDMGIARYHFELGSGKDHSIWK